MIAISAVYKQFKQSNFKHTVKIISFIWSAYCMLHDTHFSWGFYEGSAAVHYIFYIF